MNSHLIKIIPATLLGIAVLWLSPDITRADMQDIEAAALTTEAQVNIGYRGTSVHGAPGRAAEFSSLQSSPTFGARIATSTGPFYLNFEGRYRGDDEHNADIILSSNSLVRLSLRSDRFFHNLDHIPYATAVAGSRPDSVGGNPALPDSYAFGRRVFYTDYNPAEVYGLQIDLNEVKARIKCPDYPAHFNIAYWRFEKEGERQLRFLDHEGTKGAYAGCGGCHMQSTSRPVNSVTEEVKASADAHAGFLDIVVETLFRTFRDRESTPVDQFSTLDGALLPHDEAPDSKLREVSLKLNTAPAGGLVGSASVTLGQRENQSDLTSEGPIKAKTDYTKTSADVTYTPAEAWTVSMRYRLLDLDSDTPEMLTTYANDADVIFVREAIDITRAWYEGVVNYRPSRALALKAELRREDIERDLGPADAWTLPKEEMITRFKLGFNSRLLDNAALKLNGWAAVQRNDDPAYGTSAEESREMLLSANYVPGERWGLSMSLNALEEESDGRRVYQPDRNDLDELVRFDLARKQKQQKATLGGWVIPAAGMTVDLNYGYFRTAIDQDLLFGTDPHSTLPAQHITLKDDGVDYRQAVHSIILGGTWQPREDLSCRLEGYHIRSKAAFSPEFAREGLDYGSGGAIGVSSSADLEEISELDLVQNGLRARVHWQFDENLSCGVEATFDDYDERSNDVFDGSVQSYMASLSYTF